MATIELPFTNVRRVIMSSSPDCPESQCLVAQRRPRRVEISIIKKAFLASKGIEIFEEEDRKKGVFVGRQFYIHDPDGAVIEFSEWDGTSRLD
jgi:hypothetical protein